MAVSTITQRINIMNLQESIRADLNKLNSSSINEDEQLDEVWPALPVVAARL